MNTHGLKRIGFLLFLLTIFWTTYVDAGTQFFKLGESGALVSFSSAGTGSNIVGMGATWVYNGVLSMDFYAQPPQQDNFTHGVGLGWAVFKQTPQWPVSMELSVLSGIRYDTKPGVTIGWDASFSHEMPVDNRSTVIFSGGISTCRSISLAVSFNSLFRLFDQQIYHADAAYVYQLNPQLSLIGALGFFCTNNGKSDTVFSLGVQGKP
jgi:hypothetical protein